MRHDDRLSLGEVVGWGAVGVATGMALGIALTAWTGDVNRERLERAARRLREPAPVPRPGTAATSARAARTAILGQSTLRDLGLEVLAIAAGVVELRGWVPSRAARALAARTVRGAAGVDSVINSILVRGEDDRPAPDGPPATNQSA